MKIINHISYTIRLIFRAKRFYFTSFLIGLPLVFCNEIGAQNKYLKGQFTGENLEKSFINVVNISQYKATISQLNGEFEIEAKIGDSILISSIQYTEKKFVVKKEFFEKVLEIPLELKVNELNQIDIYSLGLSGDLEKDAKSIKTDNFSQTQLGFPAYVQKFTREERRLYSATSSQGGLSIDYLFNLINGNINKYKQLVDFEKTDNSKDQLFQIFPKQFYKEDLNVPDNLIEDFIYYCVENNPQVVILIKQQNQLLLMELLPKLAKEYIILKNNEKNKNQTIDD